MTELSRADITTLRAIRNGKVTVRREYRLYISVEGASKKRLIPLEVQGLCEERDCPGRPDEGYYILTAEGRAALQSKD